MDEAVDFKQCQLDIMQHGFEKADCNKRCRWFSHWATNYSKMNVLIIRDVWSMDALNEDQDEHAYLLH